MKPPKPRGVQVEQLIKQASALLRAGRLDEAAALAERGLAGEPRNVTLLLLRGAALTRAGKAERALAPIERAIGIEPDRPQAHLEMGMALQALNRLDEAGDAFERARALAPDSGDALAAVANHKRLRGDHEGAMNALERRVLSGEANSACVLLFAELAKRLGRAGEGVRAVREHLARGGVWAFYERRLTWALGELLDSLGEYDEAFACYERVNETDKPAWDPDAFSAAVDRMIERWTPEAFGTLCAGGVDSQLPVFVFGMPRSGTTLVEQIIASHPSACGGGEIGLASKLAVQLRGEPRPFALIEDPAVIGRSRLSRFGRGAIRRLRELEPGAERVSDKQPESMLHLGLIRAALPGASLVLCERDPMDTCLSCYFQDFRDVHGMAWTRDLVWLGRYYNDSRRALEHWTRTLGIEVHRVVYEEMVADQGAQSRRLIEAVGLGWDDACERFYEKKRSVRTASEYQVDQPIYTRSVRRHERYAKHLAALRETIDERYLA